MKAYTLNNISKVALSALKEPDKIVENILDADSILVRSYEMKDYNLPSNILAIARAGAGVNNIPFKDYAEKGVVVFNTPGANANAVKELVLCSLFLGSRDIIGGNKWVMDNVDDENIAKTVEKAKSQFAGNEIYGKTIAVLGLGKIGVLVANACVSLGMKVIGYDPYLTINNAMQLSRSIIYKEKMIDTLKDADYITIHIPMNKETVGLISKDVLNELKDNTVIINFSRDLLVDEDALKYALDSGKVKKYITDFANTNVLKYKNVICLPHLGASTVEAEDNCALMAINELKDYLENGNITNSVNYPTVNAGVKGKDMRILICHKNVPGMIMNFSSILSKSKANISHLSNKSKDEYAYTIIDVEEDVDVSELNNLDGVLRVRVLK